MVPDVELAEVKQAGPAAMIHGTAAITEQFQ
jgi:hypothetical protein